jgi:GSCFA family
MTQHPYKSQPDRAFWSRAVASDFDAYDVPAVAEPLLRDDDEIVSAGSCFASNVIPWLEPAGMRYVRTEAPHPTLAHLPENLGYRSFSAAYGNIYTARQLRQLLDRACGVWQPLEDRWHADGKVIDPFRPGLRHPATSDREFDLITAQHLAAVRAAFASATVVLLTLGLTEAWVSVADGAAFPACPGTITGQYDPARHGFVNYTVSEVRADLVGFLDRLREINPTSRVILTVSPVPLVATATDQHVLVATTYSKAVLRAAAGEVAANIPGVVYFPAYELVTGPQAPHGYYAQDRRDVTPEGVAAVMNALMANSQVAAADGTAVPQRARPEAAATAGATIESELSRRIAEADCDEVLADR